MGAVLDAFLKKQKEEDAEIGRAIRNSPYNVEINYYEDGEYFVALSEIKYGCWIRSGRGYSLRAAFVDAGLIKEVIIEQI